MRCKVTLVLSTVVAVVLAATTTTTSSVACPTDYTNHASTPHAPFSSGKHNLSSMRPPQSCRSFVSPDVEQKISQMQSLIADPDLYQLFENTWPNTLDTTVKWTGSAANDSTEELAFVITGDIDAMWLRDSANQLQSYKPILKADNTSQSLAGLYRGVINLQARYLLEYPFCQSFQPPAESGLPPSVNGAANNDQVSPPYDAQKVFECKYELDSFAAFLEVSSNYYAVTKDATFFGKYQWVETVETILNEANALMIGTYASSGAVNDSPYSFTRTTTDSEDSQDNNGLGNPYRGPISSGEGLVRSWFRPSDDATIYQGFIPANMMFASMLENTSPIAAAIGENALANEMTAFATQLRASINKLAISAVSNVANAGNSRFQSVYAFEVDGYGARNIMDDANIPSLLAAPLYDYLDVSDPTYQATRSILLSTADPYYMTGPVIEGIGSVHTGPGAVWPMSVIVRIMTSNDDDEIVSNLKMLLGSTDGLGLMHESINSFNANQYTRPWFAWVNGLFGQMILDLETRKPEILKMSFQ